MSKLTFLLCLMTQLFFCSLSHAKTELPSFDCTLSDTVSDGEIGDAKSTFNKDTPKIYLYCTSEDVKKGQKIKNEWIAIDTHNAAPPNYKIDESTLDIDRDLASGENYDAKFALSKPNAGWPVGQYEAKIYVDGELQQAVKFSVQ